MCASDIIFSFVLLFFLCLSVIFRIFLILLLLTLYHYCRQQWLPICTYIYVYVYIKHVLLLYFFFIAFVVFCCCCWCFHFVVILSFITVVRIVVYKYTANQWSRTLFFLFTQRKTHIWCIRAVLKVWLEMFTFLKSYFIIAIYRYL